MNEKETTLIVSDLHLGGGPTDPGDDHVYQGQQLVHYLRAQAESPAGQAGRLELVFNGDFLDFAQTNTAAFHLVSDDRWCTEAESLAKLETMLAGHADIFHELARFQGPGNAVTIAAGNHDVDLHWPAVQQRLASVAGAGTRFELGVEWLARYGGALQIAHGHMRDPANRFKNWARPICTQGSSPQYLEMCPGTLFMVKFVNKLEARYPFADNLLPISKLASVLLREDKGGVAAAAWALLRFIGGSSLVALHATQDQDIGTRLAERARTDAVFREAIAAALRDAELTSALEKWQSGEPTEAMLAQTMLDLLGHIDEKRWSGLFDAPSGGATLGSGSDVTLSAVARAAFQDGKSQLRSLAQDRVDATGARVVVMGHTHQPDRVALEGGEYFNPGCWTRYLELKSGQKVTLDDLKDESRYPYQLNYVRVSQRPDGGLDANMIAFDQQPGR